MLTSLPLALRIILLYVVLMFIGAMGGVAAIFLLVPWAASQGDSYMLGALAVIALVLFGPWAIGIAWTWRYVRLESARRGREMQTSDS